MDKLLLLGLNHKVAPIALRERLALKPEGVADANNQMKALLPGESEIALLSTCNRTEMIIFSDNPCIAEEAGRLFFAEKGQFTERMLTDKLYFFQGREAVQHILQVAAGLDSLVVGENEIQGQVRSAYEMAQAAGSSGPFLNTLFRIAVQCGKRVRAETEIGKTNLSVATLVVELAESCLGDLCSHTALLIGAGKISTLTARELVRAGLRCVLIANRTFERAKTLANNLGREFASAVHFDQLNENLDEADIVICSTGAPHTVLHTQPVIKAMRKRPKRPLLAVDLAIPRDIDPDIFNIPNVQLFTIDDLSKLVQEHHPITARAWKEAEGLIEDGISDFESWCFARQAVPLIRSLREKAEEIVNTEVDRTIRRLGPITPEQQSLIEHMGLAIINKLLHDPTICLKNQSDVFQQDEAFELVQTLFGLEQEQNNETRR